MKNVFTFILFSIFININLFSQVSSGGIPPSFEQKDLNKNIDSHIFKSPDLNKIKAEDLLSEQKGDPYRYGVDVPVNLNISNSGTWDVLSDGRKIWRLKLSIKGAPAIGVYYNKFFIPTGGMLYLYNEDKTQILGAYTHKTNSKNQEFATELILGDNVILEYIAPEFPTKNPDIEITSLSYAYRSVGYLIKEAKEALVSDPCEVNINCPEGNSWQDEKRGVARISIKIGSSYYLCSGSLVNNTNQDCTPYFLSAYHCGENATASDLNQWVFYFNYEASTCTGTTGSLSQSVTGATLRASAENNIGTTSDMLLLELNQSVPSTYNPYYNGWTYSTTASSNGVGIHHPAGDIKKISTYTSSLTNYYNTHWKVYWAATTTNHGVTEGGSSGSPLFNSNGYIVGTLTGGGSYCTAPDDPDYYGKFSFHWQSNGSTNDKQLKPWLDPAGTNPTSLLGTNYPCGGSTPTDCQTMNYPLTGTPKYSYMNGNNSYGDKGKANIFTAPSGYNEISTVNVEFTYHTGNANAVLGIWEDNGTGGVPGTTPIATKTVPSSTVISDINNGNTTEFTFSSPVVVSGNFYVGIILPTTAGDTLVLTSNSDGDTNPGIAWELWSDNTWHAYTETSSWQQNLSLAIYPEICKPTGINNKTEYNNFEINPNPTTGIIDINFDEKIKINTKINVYNIFGQEVNPEIIYNDKSIRLNFNNYNDGVYFIKVINDNSFTSKKVILSR